MEQYIADMNLDYNIIIKADMDTALIEAKKTFQK